MTQRRCTNWLKSLAEFVEETESAREFWLWSGIFTICAALQRKVWLPFGLYPIYPNLYIMLVAAPGKARKGPPIALAKEMLQEIKVPVGVDSFSKRALTMELVEIAKLGQYEHGGEQKQQCALSIISKELSSLLAVDPKGMIEVLTDLWDCHDAWGYKTATQGQDFIHNLCLSCFLGTTPIYISTNLPELAMGGGFSSRLIIVMGYQKYKRVTVPPIPPEKKYQDLLYDLDTISHLKGEFKWEQDAYDYFDEWYQKLDLKYAEVKDDRLHPFLERIHVMVLKTTMALRVAYSDDLTFVADDIGRSIDLLEGILVTASDALSGQGRSRTSFEVERLLGQVQTMGRVSFTELLQMNYRHTNKSELQEVMETLVGMKDKISVEHKDGEVWYTWKSKSKT